MVTLMICNHCMAVQVRQEAVSKTRAAQKSMKASGTPYGFAVRGHGEVQTIRV